MGGDDLGSDDEFLTVPVSDSNVIVDRSGKRGLASDLATARSSEDIKRQKTGDDSQTNNQGSDDPQKQLIELGIHLEKQSAKHQADFLTIAVKHYTLLSASTKVSEGQSSVLPLLPRHVRNSSYGTLVQRLTEIISTKKLKKWKHKSSPCVVITCLSARRAVEILKELAPLKVPIAKLFPKNATLDEQRKLVATTPFGIAVGTPHRLNALLELNSDSEHSLRLTKTQLVVLDSHVSTKSFSVVSLPDTAPQCATLIRDYVMPELSLRQDIHLAFL